MKEFKIVNVVISGVGGQGVVHTGQVIASAAHKSGLEVFTAEVHGMSQGSGSVFTTVRYGSRVYSPSFSEGDGDILVALELLEAVRYVNYLKPDGIVLANVQKIVPVMESLKCAPYPIHAELYLQKRTSGVILIPGLQIALTLGNANLTNYVLLGVLSTLVGFPRQAWLNAITELFSQDNLQTSRIAFMKGIAWFRESHADGASQCIGSSRQFCHAPDPLPG
jgi:indolepyruvate ferredoxin oxidoreductase beta subunit